MSGEKTFQRGAVKGDIGSVKEDVSGGKKALQSMGISREMSGGKTVFKEG